MTLRTKRASSAALAALLLLTLVPDHAAAGIFRRSRPCRGRSCVVAAAPAYARPACPSAGPGTSPGPGSVARTRATPTAGAVAYTHPTYTVPAASRGGDVLAIVNAHRAGYGLPALAYNAEEARWSHANCVEQSRSGVMGHHVKGPGGQCAGEAGSAESVVAAWMNSPDHRAILLSRGIRAAGWANIGPYWSIDVR